MILRSPDFGNTFKFVPNTRIHRTMNGDLRTYQGTIPTWEGFTVKFSALSKAQIDAFVAYVSSAAGQKVTLVDFENRTWTGIITSKTIVVRKVGRATDCKYETGFEFEGQVS